MILQSENERFIKALKYNFDFGYRAAQNEFNDEQLKDLLTEFIIYDFFSKPVIHEDIRYHYGALSLELVNFDYTIGNTLHLYLSGIVGGMSFRKTKKLGMKRSGSDVYELLNTDKDFDTKLYNYIRANIRLPFEDEVFIQEVDSLPF